MTKQSTLNPVGLIWIVPKTLAYVLLVVEKIIHVQKILLKSRHTGADLRQKASSATLPERPPLLSLPFSSPSPLLSSPLPSPPLPQKSCPLKSS